MPLLRFTEFASSSSSAPHMKYGLLRRKTYAEPETLYDAKERETERKINKEKLIEREGEEREGERNKIRKRE